MLNNVELIIDNIVHRDYIICFTYKTQSLATGVVSLKVGEVKQKFLLLFMHRIIRTPLFKILDVPLVVWLNWSEIHALHQPFTHRFSHLQYCQHSLGLHIFLTFSGCLGFDAASPISKCTSMPCIRSQLLSLSYTSCDCHVHRCTFYSKARSYMRKEKISGTLVIQS